MHRPVSYVSNNQSRSTLGLVSPEERTNHFVSQGRLDCIVTQFAQCQASTTAQVDQYYLITMPPWFSDEEDFGIPFVPPQQSPLSETDTAVPHEPDRAVKKLSTLRASPPSTDIAEEWHIPVPSSQQTSILAPDPSLRVWVKIHGFPQWPALRASLEDVPLIKFHTVRKAQRPGCQLIYMGDQMYVWAKPAQITAWECQHFQTLASNGSKYCVLQVAWTRRENRRPTRQVLHRSSQRQRTPRRRSPT